MTNRPRPATSTQPQVDPTLRIYGSRPVEPIGESNQPEVIPVKVYGSKVLPTIHVKLKSSSDDRVLVINAQDFDDDRYVRLD